MFSVRKPHTEDVASFLASLGDCRFSYEPHELTRRVEQLEDEAHAAGYVVDWYSVVVGAGADVFQRAKESLLGWRHFDIDWVELHGPSRVEPGTDVAVLVRLRGFWSLNGCRVVYVDDEPEGSLGAECAFAYGTLPGHAESGEERFSVRWDRATDDVSYSIVAVSKPALLVARLGAPVVRALQKRFGRSSLDAMQRAVCGVARRL